VKNKPNRILIACFAMGLVAVSLAMGCGGDPGPPSSSIDPAVESSGNPAQAATRPNPAAEKCIQDGFTLAPIMENGVPRGYLCINPENGKKCGAWDYYRGECKLD